MEFSDTVLQLHFFQNRECEPAETLTVKLLGQRKHCLASFTYHEAGRFLLSPENTGEAEEWIKKHALEIISEFLDEGREDAEKGTVTFSGTSQSFFKVVQAIVQGCSIVVMSAKKDQ